MNYVRLSFVIRNSELTRQCECGGKREHLGPSKRQNVSVPGVITIRRVYRKCRQCQELLHPTDEMLGVENRHTVGVRDLAVFAAADSSFDKAEKRLLKFCGLKIAANTIKTLCDKESVKMKQWQENNPLSWKEFVEAEGEIEFTAMRITNYELRSFIIQNS